MRQVRTDLAMEAFQAAGGSGLPGVRVSHWEQMGVTVTEVTVETTEAADKLGKSVGNYLTLECEGVRKRDPQSRAAVSGILGEELARLLPPDEEGAPILVVGLGNRFVTPDSLGPLSVDGTLVTRHLFRELPETVDERMGVVCAVAPGVLGVTGLETMEVIKSLADTLKPRCVIAVDSLAACASKRLGVTVQLTDAGIHPGSGVGNIRKALTRETLNVTVLAIGVPTVVYASTIVRDALTHMSGEEESEETIENVTRQLFQEEMGDMIVTPREIDEMISDAAYIVSSGINRALHPGLSAEEIETMKQ